MKLRLSAAAMYRALTIIKAFPIRTHQEWAMVDSLVRALEFTPEDKAKVGFEEFARDGQTFFSFDGTVVLERDIDPRHAEALRLMLSAIPQDGPAWRYNDIKLFNEIMLALGGGTIGKIEREGEA